MDGMYVIVRDHPVQCFCVLAWVFLCWKTLSAWIEAKRFQLTWRGTREVLEGLLKYNSTGFQERFTRCSNGAVSDDPVCHDVIRKLNSVAHEARSRAELVERMDDHLEGMCQPLIKAIGTLAGQIPNYAICLSGIGFSGVLLSPILKAKAAGQPFGEVFTANLDTFFGEFGIAVLVNCGCMWLASWATATRESLYLNKFKTALLVRAVADRLIAIGRTSHASRN